MRQPGDSLLRRIAQAPGFAASLTLNNCLETYVSLGRCQILIRQSTRKKKCPKEILDDASLPFILHIHSTWEWGLKDEEFNPATPSYSPWLRRAGTAFMWTHGHTGVLCSHDGALGKKALGIFLSYTPPPPPHTHTGLVKKFLQWLQIPGFQFTS